MDPKFDDLRLSGSLKEWVTEMMENCYEFLEILEGVIRKQAAKRVSRKTSRLGLDGGITNID